MVTQSYYLEVVSRLQITKVNTNGTLRAHKVEESRDSERSSVRSRQLEFVGQNNGNKGVAQRKSPRDL